MNKEQLIKKMAESIGAIDKEVKTAFDIFLKRMSELLDLNQSIRIPEIGIFQLKKRSAIRQDRREMQPTKNVAESYYLLFVPLHYNKTSPNEILAFKVPEKRKNDPVAVEDTAFSLSYGKPVIPLNEAQRREFVVQSSYLLLQKSLEQKVERLLAGAIHLNDFNIDYRQVILEDDERNESFDLKKELDETAGNANETVEWDFGQESNDIPDNEFIPGDTEAPAGEFSPITAEETIPGETFPLKAEDESFTFDIDNPEFKSELTADTDMLAEEMLPGSEETPSTSFPEPEEPAQPFLTEADKGPGADDTEDLLSRIVWEPEEENISDSFSSQSDDDLSGNEEESSSVISESDAGEFKFEDFNFEEFNREETYSNQAEDEQAFDENEVLGDELVIPEEETEEEQEPEEFNAERFDESSEEAKPSESLPELEEEFGEEKREGLSPLFWGILIVLVLVTSAGIYYFLFSDRSGKVSAAGAAAGSAEKAQIIERDYDVPVSYIPDEKPESNTNSQAGAQNEAAVTENTNTALPNKTEENRTADNKAADNNKTAAAETKPAAEKKDDSSEGIFRNDKKDQMVQSQIFSDGSRFTVQLSSWKQRSVAEKEARRLRSAGYDAYVATYSPTSSTKWYRVRIGNYASVNEAENVLRKVK